MFRIKTTYIPLFIIAALAIFCSSCFKEDEKIFPPLPGDAAVYKFGSSIYDFQSYFDFSSDSCTLVSANDTWQIEFATADSSWEVRINSAAYYEVYPTTDTAFTGISSVTNPLKYLFDSSSGNPDSCAFSSWLNREAKPVVPSREVFLVGKFDGLKVIPKWKIRIDSVDNNYFWFTYATFPAGTAVSVQLFKDKTVSLLQYNLVSGSAVQGEPLKNNYDILFAQYGTILLDNEGVPTPYFVRGILLNPNKVEAALDTIHVFEDISYDLIKDFKFSNRRDVIGHEWKDVKVDVNTNTAEYFVNPKIVWLIRDTEGFIYKLKFIEFYNSQAEVGYTTIEYQRL